MRTLGPSITELERQAAASLARSRARRLEDLEATHVAAELVRARRRDRLERLAIIVAIAIGLAAAIILASGPTAEARYPRPPVERIIYAPCPHTFEFRTDGCAYADGRVYVEHRGDRLTLRHERAHLVDEQLLTPGDRNYFARVTGRAGVAWAAGATPTEQIESPRERFAELYALCTLGMMPDGSGRDLDGLAWQTSTGYDPTAKEHRRNCAALERLEARVSARTSPPRAGVA